MWAKFQGLACTSTGTQTAETQHFRNRKKNVLCWIQRRGPRRVNSPATVSFDLLLHRLLEDNWRGKENQRWKKNSKVSQKQNKQICSTHFLEIKDPTWITSQRGFQSSIWLQNSLVLHAKTIWHFTKPSSLNTAHGPWQQPDFKKLYHK